MNFSLDACLASIILATALVYFMFTCLSVLPKTYYHQDDCYVIIGRLLRYYDLQYAIYTNNTKMIEAIINSIIYYENDYYFAVIDPNTNSTIIEVGNKRLRYEVIAVPIPGWKGEIKPRIIIFRIGVRG